MKENNLTFVLLLLFAMVILAFFRLQFTGLNHGDDHSDGNSILAGKNFAKEGFLNLGLIPSTQPQASAGKEVYPNYPQGADLASGVIQKLLPKGSLSGFRAIMVCISLIGLLIFYFFLLEITKSPALSLFGSLLLLLNPVYISLLDSLHQTPYTWVFVSATLFLSARMVDCETGGTPFKKLVFLLAVFGFLNAWFTYETIVGLALIPFLVLVFLKRTTLVSAVLWSAIIGLGAGIASLIRLGIAAAHFGGAGEAVGYFLALAKERSLSGVERENMLTLSNWITSVWSTIFETAFFAPAVIVIAIVLLLFSISKAPEGKPVGSIIAWLGITFFAGASWYFLMPAHTVAHSGLSFIHRHLLIPSVLFWLATTLAIIQTLKKSEIPAKQKRLFQSVAFVPGILIMLIGLFKTDLPFTEAARARNAEFAKLSEQLRETGERIDPSLPGGTNYLRRPFLSYYTDRNLVWLNGPREYLAKGSNLKFFLLIPYQTPEVQDLYNKLLADGFTVSERLENGYLPIIVLKK